MNHAAYVLPLSVMTRSDLRRLVNEIETIDMSLTTDALRRRSATKDIVAPITVSSQLSDFIAANRLDLRDARARAQVIAEIRLLKMSAPVVHLTFATSVTTETLGKMMQWLRSSLSQQVVMTVGLQPELIGGVVVRTANRIFDLSVKAQLANSRQIIVKELETIDGAK